MRDVNTFRFWCYKVLPLVYDDSLSYYELLCKVYKYINDLIEQDKVYGDEIEQLRKDMDTVQKWINDYDTEFAKNIIEEWITKCIKTVTFGISTGGYFMACIPEGWKDVKFGTIQDGNLYGHLTLQYD